MKKVELYVLIPDKASGDYFNETLAKFNIETEYGYYYIHPRVINNKLTASKNVVGDMNRIFRTFKDKTKSVVIACNTLQLWLRDIKSTYIKQVKVYTTFEACEWKFGADKDKPLWLGTTPLVERTSKFPTLLSLKMTQTQNEVQELIWRIKLLNGDDIRTAFDYVRADKNLSRGQQQKKIADLKHRLILAIKKSGIKKVILGCTDLPMIFRDEHEAGVEWIDPAVVLAEYVKHQSVMMVFAGGTISGLANKDGTVVGGRVFNLIERLSYHMPGSFRHLNITKSGVIYRGLSENLSYPILEKMWQGIKEVLMAEPNRIVVTHGTDAMEHAAIYIEKRLRESGLRSNTEIIFTGSNDLPLKKNTDAWGNLRVAINGPIPEKNNSQKVWIVFNNRWVLPKEVVKIYIRGRNMFVSRVSREFEIFLRNYRRKVKLVCKNILLKQTNMPIMSGVIEYRVNRISRGHAGLMKIVGNNNIKAVLFKLYHSGTAYTNKGRLSVAELVKKMTEKGIVCFGATESGEPTDLHAYETSVKLLRAGMVPLYDMLYDVAKFKLQLLNLTKNNYTRAEVIEKMLVSYAGEIDGKRIIKRDIEKLVGK